MSTLFPVVIASGFHLFPFRTEKLSPTAPMVLRKRESRSPPSYFQVEALPARLLGGLFVSLYRANAALFRTGPMRRCFVASAALFRYDRSVVLSRPLLQATESSRQHNASLKPALKAQSKVLAYARVSFLPFHYLCRYDCL